MIATALFSVDPVVVFLSSDWDPAYDALRELGIRVLVYDPYTNILRDGDETVVGHRGAIPTCPCVLVVARLGSEREVNALRASWGDSPIICRLYASGQNEPVGGLLASTAPIGALQIFRHILIAMLNAQTLAAKVNVELSEQIIALRSEVEHHRSLLAEMIKAFPDGLLRLQASIEPSPEVVAPFVNNNGVLTFELPYETWGLARLDLQFQGRCCDGYLEVKLETVTASRVLGEWKLAFSDVTEDWQPFLLGRPCFQREYGVKLTLNWGKKVKSAPALRMSDVVILPRGEAFIDINVEAVQLPALRLWRGVPDATREG